MFSERDLKQIVSHGLTESRVKEQIECFVSGFTCLNVKSVASAGNGIRRVGVAEISKYEEIYSNASNKIKIAKFVPASGAATRMLKDLFSFLSENKKNDVVEKVLSNIDKFAFASVLRASLPDNADEQQIIAAILSGKLNYGSKPKGMILFHSYHDEARTAFEEHLCEGAAYAESGGRVNIHFTVSPEHIDGFRQLLTRNIEKYQERFGVKYDISFSVQKSSTDTIAVDNENKLFRNNDGSLLFRPAGHGALIENLNDLDADIVFIKNIDNVTTDALRSETILYKRVLAGILLELMECSFRYIDMIDRNSADLHEVADFIENRLCVKIPISWKELPADGLAAKLRFLLNRPLRVCGMVRNDGEPGGGPFWVQNSDETVSLQIAESSQISESDKILLKSSTHFNPVDLVCGLKDYKGNKFDLTQYVDPQTGFISNKSKSGRDLKALELPGLWNGAMSKWNTIFVEVPISTFTPVKVITDLLRAQHQPIGE